jgi:AraC family transcriptional regulator
MGIKCWVIGHGDVGHFRDEAEYRAFAQGKPVLMLAEGRHNLAWNCWVPPSLWTPIRGNARVVGRELRAEIEPNAVFLAEQGSRVTVQAVAASAAGLVGLLLPPELIRAEALRRGVPVEEPALFPAIVKADPALQVPLVRLASLTAPGADSSATADALVAEIVEQIVRRHAELAPWVERCPGRSPRYRRQVLLRLLRARNHIEHATGEDASLKRLAEIAKMSPTHFLRLYRDVFGQTPHKHVVQSRLAAARELLLHGELGVSAVYRALGFENRCAFSRVFKQHFGVPPTAMRARARQMPRRHASLNERAGVATIASIA